ncbi:RagB/SusD family nutrient uptake outer membrane protein [Flavobacteriaceae bacterium F08102]|nr:RagB/SusD family nutrient uptake outer membrane protein [Flavobacteriaceae bacterium F08102]
MKTIKHIYIYILSLVFLGISSCQLAEELDDFKPLNALDANDAIIDESTSELALAGVYAGFHQQNSGVGIPEIYTIPSLMSGVLINTFLFNNDEVQGYVNNNPLSVNTSQGLGAYTRMYDIINRANWLIEKDEALTDDKFPTPGRRQEIIAEAKMLRATANFYLLRLWGQFYDNTSPYGISIRTEPSRSGNALPRSSVSDSYEAIIDDLNYAIANGPYLRAKYYTNTAYAKGLKAKVLLYQGKYAEAATLAKSIIDTQDPNFALSESYGEIFLDHSTPDLFDSAEILFGTKGEPAAGIGIGNVIGTIEAVTPTYINSALASTVIAGQTISHDATRVSSTVMSGFFGFDSLKSNFNFFPPANIYEMVYHLRMAEIYLIYAEADARATNSVRSDALNALNTIRERAGATTTGNDGFETYPASITLSQFLEAIRIEKRIELGVETGEDWFDLVRYHFVDGFDVTTVKPSATNPDKYILPIDYVTIEAGKNVVEQNPSY